MNNTIKNETTEVAVLQSKHNKTNESQEMGSSNNTSNIDSNDNDDDDDEQGHVTAHNITTATTTTNRNRLGGRALPSVSPSTSSSKSSWASNDDVRRACLLYTSPSPRDLQGSRMPSSA